MDQTTLLRLHEIGIDTEELLERCMGNEKLACRLLLKFVDDRNYDSLTDALAANDTEKAIAAAHALKGMCGNLSMKRLQTLFETELTLLRGGDVATARELFGEASAVYTETRLALPSLLGPIG